MFQESQLLLFAAAYLIGSIPFGLILTRAAGMGDIRQIGSGNIGATNVLRAGGKKVALLTLLLDMGKGYAAVTLYWFYMRHYALIDLEAHLIIAIGLTVIIGHCFSIWLRFKGGKGVATAFGVLFALSLDLGLACIATWLTIFIITRYSSLSALTAITLMPFYAQLLELTPTIETSFILALIPLLVIFRHHSNIRNLLNGTEHKFGRKKDE